MAGLKRMPDRLSAVPDRIKHPPKAALPYYHDPRWIALVKAIKAHRGNVCERCGGDHRVLGDHIIELKDGGALLDPGNVELLCQRCHARKTEKAKAARVGR